MNTLKQLDTAGMSDYNQRTLSRLQDYTDTFKKAFPKEEKDEMGFVVSRREFLHLHYYEETKGDVILRGFKPIFRFTDLHEDEACIQEGSFTVLSQSPCSRSKYTPHQGKQEIKRRKNR